MKQQNTPGAIALVGSGEYTPAMADTDRYLFGTLGGHGVRAALIPTASAREVGMPERWNQQGVEHFRALGTEATPVLLLDRADATDPRVVAALEGADFYYFSGGDPEYLVETLRETLAWDTIRAAHRAGAVVAGCSAGAMLLGDYTLRVRAIVAGRAPDWQPSFGLARGVSILPHFDRIQSFAGPDVFRRIVETAPAGTTLVGVDEDTALVQLSAGRWRVFGRQGVTIFGPGGEPAVYHAGAEIAVGA